MFLFCLSFPLAGNPSFLIQKDSGQARMTDSTPCDSAAAQFIDYGEKINEKIT